MKVDLLDIMGSDLTVVNAARVSFAAESDEFGSRDKKLIRYLAKHNHWTPFGHVQVQFRVKAPVFVARQLVKHQVGLVWNEISRRYVDIIPEFHQPDSWRKKADNKKQGSSEESFEGREAKRWDTLYSDLVENSKALYGNMIAAGVAPEQARMVLPQSMMTEWYWTGSLAAFARVVQQRISSDAQYECQIIAQKIDQALAVAEEVSYSWACLTEPKVKPSEKE
jgi:thymidylate synthase (FAD)